MDNVVVIRDDADAAAAAETVGRARRRFEGGRDRSRVRHAVAVESNWGSPRSESMLDEGREINESIKRYIVYHIHRDRATALLGRAILERDQSLLRRAKKFLEAYKILEQMCLLELAVWKFVCVSDIPPDMSLKTLVAWKLWESEGWKVNKKRHWHCKEAPIIITAVLPFLSDNVRLLYGGTAQSQM